MTLYRRVLEPQWIGYASDGWTMCSDPWFVFAVGRWDAWFKKEEQCDEHPE